MSDMEGYPYVSSFKDRHGKLRYRVRRGTKSAYLPGSPGQSEFEEHYAAFLEGREPRKAVILEHPNKRIPRSFGDAWQRVTRSAEWRDGSDATRDKNRRLAKEFLDSRVAADSPDLWRDMPISDLKRRHVKAILADYSDTPHKAKHLLVCIRKMIQVAFDEEWIEIDPTHRIRWRPPYKGWRAWKLEERRKFCERWEIGSTPRLVYCLGLWLGHRRGDVAALRWEWKTTRLVTVGEQLVEVQGFEVRTRKTSHPMFIPIAPELEQCLAATPDQNETVLVTQYGKPFSAKSLTGRMADWTRSAGLAPGCTLHGLRKTLGKLTAEGGSSTRELMELLGHTDIEHAELYSREAEQARLAVAALANAVRVSNLG